MSKNQIEGHASEAKGKGSKAKSDKHDGKGGAVLADINDDAGKRSGKDAAESGDAGKKSGKADTVLANINDEPKKKS
ncbi:hypothetical protein [Halomonas urumqiensis]|uniref:Uncharacterized protein n=1 Tax=Halomonas urumqiensis TaxID=1684789 RepID=A0A2N7UP46_9GAMM|nr:hypothetical protein [Halomonas urumqiensis]PMR82162.1 hypothetical protein C1H70_02905 [Halomonas urumqiensis]PTB03062.1 hypothetical protein C6V82_00610 [Halomonas urumqiensis]GHE20806.1 hypothetical protein GCM10017767_13270 [Halomonas urumqiensis]